MKGTVCIKIRFTAFVILLNSLIRADGAVCNRAWTTVWSRIYYMQRHCSPPAELLTNSRRPSVGGNHNTLTQLHKTCRQT